ASPDSGACNLTSAGGPHHEVIKPPLREMVSLLRPKLCLTSIRASSVPHPSCPTLLECLHHGGRTPPLRFANQQMEMRRHDPLSEHAEAVAAPHLLQNREQYIGPPRRIQGLATPRGARQPMFTNPHPTLAATITQVPHTGANGALNA